MRLLIKLWQWLPIPYQLRWRIIWLIVPKFLVGAAAIILDDRGRILLFHHTYRKKYPWGPPGGFLNHGEDAAEAIVREMQEEAGFMIRVEKLLWIGTSRQYPRVDIYYLCKHLGGDFSPSEEVSEFRFFEIEAATQIMEPELADMLKQALAGLNERPSK
jgi:ADP-ribose pyrophosphatase YjhB (NUDIX family)